jgi:hypothetical protein
MHISVNPSFLCNGIFCF